MSLRNVRDVEINSEELSKQVKVFSDQLDLDEDMASNFDPHFCIWKNLLSNMQNLKKYFPPKPKNVLSLACGLSHEYIALAALYQGTDFNYVGIDISQEVSKDTLPMYKKYPNFNLITCDGTNAEEIYQNLHYRKLMPKEGFDIIFIRHPDILSRERCEIFYVMLNKIIPYCAAENAMIYLSTHHLSELAVCYKIFHANRAYKFNPNENYVQSGVPITLLNSNLSLKVDHHTLVVNCEGLALNQQVTPKINCSNLFATTYTTPVNEISLEVSRIANNVSDAASLQAPLNNKNYELLLQKAIEGKYLTLVELIIKHKDALGVGIHEDDNKNAMDCILALKDSEIKKGIMETFERDQKTSHSRLEM